MTAGTGVRGDPDEQARAVARVAEVLAAAELNKRRGLTAAVRDCLTLAELTRGRQLMPASRKKLRLAVPAAGWTCLQPLMSVTTWR